MPGENCLFDPDGWARLRFAIIGPLLADPPPAGELGARLKALSAKDWRHPVTALPVRFGFATLERWVYWSEGKLRRERQHRHRWRHHRHRYAFQVVKARPAGPCCGSRRNIMLETIAVVLVVLWLLGLVTSTTMGGLIHVLLVIAVVVILIRVIQGRGI